MFRHRFEETPSAFVAFHWFLLSFSGGCINAGGFLATGRFVSHVTGFATLFGVGTTSRHLGAAVGVLSVPLFFLLGAFLAGLLVDRPQHLGKRPHFDWVMGLSALCLFFAAAGAGLRFSAFGAEVSLKHSYVLLALLCLASGLQNAAITSSSGRSVRSTHLTGLTTDLGLGLSHLLYLKGDKFSRESWLIQMRIGSIAAFVFGSAVGAWVFVHLGYPGFLLPGLISAYAAWKGHREKRAFGGGTP